MSGAAGLTLTMGDYLLYSFVGLCVVFFALTLLMVVIHVLSWCLRDRSAAGAGAEAAAGAAAPAPAGAVAAPAPALAPGSAGECKLYDTPPRDAAMVMAIVADQLGAPLNELRFISIRKVEQ